MIALEDLPQYRILAFDPGGSTGIVDVENGQIRESETLSLDTLKDRLTSGWWEPELYHAWVAEDFFLTKGSSLYKQNSLLSPVRVLSWLEYRLYHHDIPLVKQTPSDVKYFVTRERLEAHRWWEHLRTNHERDAARHALFYLYRQRGGKLK